MKRIQELRKKAFKTLKRDGLRVFFKKSINFLKQRINKKNIYTPDKTFMDVLFINGCYLPHPSRYRIDHQREQLFANGISSNEIFYEKLTLNLVKYYRLFIFFRCPATENVEHFIHLAKESNKTVLFDIDDLVIDVKYTNLIKYVNQMPSDDKRLYDDGVNRMQKVLRLCDAAVTTTPCLANELRNYVPEVYVNRNTASERMVEASLDALRPETRNGRPAGDGFIKIGYFSGSITHNDDIHMILPALLKIMAEYKNVQIHFIGELDLPTEMKPFKSRIIARQFMEWTELPKCIASVDINIAPLEDTIFNEAKSENKWVEAALVKVPTIASNVGAMKDMIRHNETGILCENTEADWYNALATLIEDEGKRRKIAKEAHRFVINQCTTLYTGFHYAQYIRSKFKPNIAFVVPSVQTSGGVLVILKHCNILRKAGYDVIVLNEDKGSQDIVKEGETISVISLKDAEILGSFNKAVATLWSTTEYMKSNPNIQERYYLVQNFETDFYEPGQAFRQMANQTYSIYTPEVKYITISKWCQSWLRERFERDSIYAPNGIDLKMFQPKKRKLDAKTRILIEGNSEDHYKNVDESFRVIQELDPNQFEIWYMSYKGEPKPWYRVDKFLHKVPYEYVPQVYSECDILLKSSLLESFSYPPLEMMATGGYAVVAANEGNLEYLRDGENCMLYNAGNIDKAVQSIKAILSDSVLQETLYNNGLKTANSRNWEAIEQDILNLYK